MSLDSPRVKQKIFLVLDAPQLAPPAPVTTARTRVWGKPRIRRHPDADNQDIQKNFRPLRLDHRIHALLVITDQGTPTNRRAMIQRLLRMNHKAARGSSTIRSPRRALLNRSPRLN